MRICIAFFCLLLGFCSALPAQDIAPFLAREEAKQGLWGYQDTKNGRILVMPQYHSASSFQEGLARVSFFGKYGFINAEGSVVIPLVYDELLPFKDGIAAAKLNGKAGAINTKNQVILPFEYDQVQSPAAKRIRVRQNKRFGYADLSGQIVIPIIYEAASPFSEFGLALAQKDDHYGFLNANGEEVIPFIYDDAHEFDKNGLAPVRLETKYGCLDTKGIAVVPIIYDEPISFVQQTAVVRRNDAYGLISYRGNEIIHTNYQAVKPLSEGKIAVKKNEQWHFLNPSGAILFKMPEGYELYETFENGLAKTFLKNHFGLIDSLGKTIHEPVFNEISEFQKGFAIVKKEKKYAIIGQNGQLLCPLIYDDMWRSERTNCVYVRKGRYVGAVTAQGAVIAPPIYDHCEFLSQKPIALLVQKGSRFGLYNALGKLLLPLEYEGLGALENNLLVVTENNQIGCAGMNGKIIIPPAYDHLAEYSDKHLVLVKNGAYSLYSLMGKKVLPKTFKKIVLASVQGHFWVNENGFFALFSPDAKPLTPFVYTKVAVQKLNFFWCQADSQTHFLNASGQRVKSFVQDILPDFEPFLLPFLNENNKVGFMNWQNQVVVAPEFSQVLPFSEGLAPVKIGDFWGMIDSLGVQVLPFDYEQVMPSVGGRIWLKKPRQGWMCQTLQGMNIKVDRVVSDVFFDLQTNYLWSKEERTGRFGLLSQGVEMHPHIFEGVSAMMANNRLFVKLNGKWQYINSVNQILFTNYDEVDYAVSGNFYIKKVRLGNKFAFFDCRAEKLLTDFVFDNAGSFHFTFKGSDGLVGFAEPEVAYAKVMKEGKWAIIDLKARLVTQFAFDDIELFNNGLAKVRYKNKYGYIDARANLKIDFLYDEASNFKNGYAFVKRDKQWGIIDLQGKFIVEPRFEDVISTNLSNVVAVTKNNLYGFIDLKKGILPTKFYNSTSTVFVGGLLEVESNDLKGFIDIYTKEIVAPQYQQVSHTEESLVAVKKDNLWGFIDKNGAIIIPFQFDYAESFNHLSQAPVKKKGEQFFINLKGERELPKSGWLDTDIFDSNDEDW